MLTSRKADTFRVAHEDYSVHFDMNRGFGFHSNLKHVSLSNQEYPFFAELS